MMRAVLRKVVVCALLAGALGCAQTLDEAVRTLAKKVMSRLAPADLPRVTARSVSGQGAADAAQAKTIFDRAIRRPVPRSPLPLDVTLTLSQNVRGYLLVADFERNGEHVAEMVEYRPALAPRSSQRAILDKQLLWEQDTPMLDVAVDGDRMWVLEPASLISYSRRAGAWERSETRALESAPLVRDPRGRLEVVAGAANVFLPGQEQHFPLSSMPVKFSAARNTLETEGWPPFFSYARVDDLQLFAETDGRLHAYDGDKRPVGVFDTWGSDVVATGSACGPALASSANDRDSSDTLTAFRIVDRKPVAAGDPLQFSGAITSLWPTPGGAMAITRPSTSGKYAAYNVTVRCSQ
jgi:hypothetical protein